MQNGRSHDRHAPDGAKRLNGLAPRSSMRQGPSQPGPVQDVLHQMRSSLDALDATFQNINDQTRDVATLAIADPSTQLHNLELEMHDQDRRQAQKIDEIKELIQQVVANQVAEQIKRLFANEIESLIQREVNRQVALQLETHIPNGLLQQVDEQKRQLVDVDRSLHNAEARRINNLIKSSNLNEPLRGLLRTSGKPSDIFPRDLMDLFNRDDAAIKRLLKEFDLSDSGSREKNLNTFMSFIGVAFQLITAPASAPTTPTNNNTNNNNVNNVNATNRRIR